jgi:hypothetical protein
MLDTVLQPLRHLMTRRSVPQSAKHRPHVHRRKHWLLQGRYRGRALDAGEAQTAGAQAAAGADRGPGHAAAAGADCQPAACLQVLQGVKGWLSLRA